MIRTAIASAVIGLSFLVGLWVHDAANPLILFPFFLISAYLLMSGRLAQLDLRDPSLLLLLGLFAVWLVSSFTSVAPFNSKVTLLVLSCLPLSYLLWRDVLHHHKVQALLLGALASLTALLSLYSAYQVFFTPEALSGHRASAPFLDANLLGLLCGMTSLLMLPISLTQPRFKIAAIGCMLICLLGLILTQSRSALIGTALGAIPLLICHYTSFTRRQKHGFGLAGLLLITGIWISGLFGRFTGMAQDEEILSRISLWQAGLDMTMVHPWHGFGLGSFALVYPQFREGGVDNSAGIWVHMDPLQWGIEAGVIAPLFFYALIAYVLWMSLRRLKTLSSTQHGALGALMCLLVCVHTAYPLHVSSFMVLFTGMIAVLTPRPNVSLPSSHTQLGFGLPIMVVLLALLWTATQAATTLSLWQSVQKPQADSAGALEKCLQQADPQFAFCKFKFIEARLATGQAADEALRLYIEDSRTDNQMLPQPDYYLGLYYLRSAPDQFDQVISAFSNSLKIDPTFWLASKRLSEFQEVTGDLAGALKTLEKAADYPIPRTDIPYYTERVATLRARINTQ